MAALKAIVTANATVEKGGREVRRLRVAATARTGKCAPIAATICAAFLESIAVTVTLETMKFVRIARRCRTVKIRAGPQILIAAHALPGDLNQALAKINSADSAY
jgi:hypothetical protein